MQILDQAVEAIRKQAGKGRVDGTRVAATFEAIAACGEEAARIWQGYLNSPGAAGDKYTIVSWIGGERAKQLHELTLKADVLVKQACAAAGDQARFLVLDESPVMNAYRGLKEGETGTQAAQAMLAQQQANNKHLRALADNVRAIRPAAKAPTAKKPAAKKKPAPKSAKKKPAPKKAVKKAARKAARKAPKKK